MVCLRKKEKKNNFYIEEERNWQGSGYLSFKRLVNFSAKILGAPIPILYCNRCGEVPVSEKDLPVLLPKNVDFQPGGPSPLAQVMSLSIPFARFVVVRQKRNRYHGYLHVFFLVFSPLLFTLDRPRTF